MSNSNFNEFFGPTLHWAQNQMYGINEDGEQAQILNGLQKGIKRASYVLRRT